MNLVKASVLLLMALALSACTLGSGRMESARVETPGVRRVEFEGVGELEIVQGDQEALEIEAESDVIERITAEVRGDTLIIRLRRSFWQSRTIPTRSIRYSLVVRDLESVTLSGAGNVQIGELNTDRLAVELNGAGATKVMNLVARDLVVRQRGAGSATISGQVDAQDVLVAGAGSYKAGDLASQTAHIEITGAGDATVWAEQRLEATIQGVGSIRYYGDPMLDQQISGIGQVKRLGAR